MISKKSICVKRFYFAACVDKIFLFLPEVPMDSRLQECVNNATFETNLMNKSNRIS